MLQLRNYCAKVWIAVNNFSVIVVFGDFYAQLSRHNLNSPMTVVDTGLNLGPPLPPSLWIRH